MIRTTYLFSLALICCCLTTPASGIRVVDWTKQTVTIERQVRINPPGAADSRYSYVSFDVPPRAVRIQIRYEYERANGANTIDIGLLDSRSTDSDNPTQGFRGWSGGRRPEFFVSRNEATPGYVPGEIGAGTWRIILGLYRVSAGMDISFKIEIQTEENEASVEIPESQTSLASTKYAAQRLTDGLNQNKPEPVSNGQRWWRGDLHMHTVHSDGDWTTSELVHAARKSELDFICITDHNTPSHHAEIDNSSGDKGWPLVMRGEEITTYGGHTNAWGLPSGGWIDFRVHPGSAPGIMKTVAQAHSLGALISINHPFGLCSGCSWSYGNAAKGFDAIEVWNGDWDQTDELALGMWDKVLQSGRHITGIASSDSHRATNPIGQPTSHVAARNLSQPEVLEGIKQGRVYLTSTVNRPMISFEARRAGTRELRATIGDRMRLNTRSVVRFFVTVESAPPDATISLISNGQVVRSLLAKANGEPSVIEITCNQDAYFRVEVRDGVRKMLALTNPIYIKYGSRLS